MGKFSSKFKKEGIAVVRPVDRLVSLREERNSRYSKDKLEEPCGESIFLRPQRKDLGLESKLAGVKNMKI